MRVKVECDLGLTIIEAKTIREAEKEAERMYHGPYYVAEATKEDIDWYLAMSGCQGGR